MGEIFDDCLLLLFGAYLTWQIVFFGQPKGLGSIEQVQRKADEWLRTVKVPVIGSGLAFDGSQVAIMDREDDLIMGNSSQVTDYGCNYLVRDNSGEYFLVIYRHGEKPYVKHTPHHVARARLKGKYIPPDNAA